MAQTCRLPHRSDFVCLLRDFDRAGEATGMPVRDPEQTLVRGATAVCGFARDCWFDHNRPSRVEAYQVKRILAGIDTNGDSCGIGLARHGVVLLLLD